MTGLIDRLRQDGRVTMICPDGRITLAEGVHRFVSVDRGPTGTGLWFRDPGGFDHYLPIDSEAGVTVGPHGFVVTKFGVSIHVTFWREGHACDDRS